MLILITLTLIFGKDFLPQPLQDKVTVLEGFVLERTSPIREKLKPTS